MSLLNPVAAIGQTFRNLNEKRIANLMGKRGKEVSGTEFKIGQFVLLSDEFDARAEARAKISIPNRNRLYKIVNLNKNGFTASILDVLSGSKKEVLTSRLCSIDLQTLEMFNFSTPTFFRNLQRLTDAVRRKYVPPPRAPATGLQLLSPGDAVLSEDGVDHGNDGGDHSTDGVGPGVPDTDHTMYNVTGTDHAMYNVTDTDHTMYNVIDGNVEHGVTVDSPHRNDGHAHPTTGGGHFQENDREGGDEEEEEGGNGKDGSTKLRCG